MNEAFGLIADASRPESPRPASGPFGSEQWAILERIARGESMDELLRSIVNMVEHEAQHMLCAILVFDPGSGLLRRGAAERLPAALSGALDGLRVGPGGGSCGMAASKRQPVIVTDISTHPAWAGKQQPFLAHGLRACWSSPILSPAGELLGTIGMYFGEARGPSPEECAWAEAATHLAAIALSRARTTRDNERLLHALGDRVKELSLLHDSARLLQTRGVGLREQLEALVSMIPRGLRSPERCRARIAAPGLVAMTPGFSDGPCKHVAHATAGKQQVSIEVVYVGAPQPEAESAFSAEERSLLESLADLVGAHVEKHDAEGILRGALAELRDKNQRLEFHMRHMPLGYVVWNADRTASEWNGAAERMFGWSRAEILGKASHQLPIACATERTQDPLGAALARCQPPGTRSTLEHTHKDGSRLVCEWLHTPLLDDAGQVVGYLSLVHDVSERARAERDRARLESQLQKAQRIRSLGTLAGGIAHDFNNILTAISGHAYLGLSDLEEERSPRESLHAIQEASVRAVELVRRILTFSRNQEPDRKRCELEPIVNEAVERVRTNLPAGVSVLRQVDGALPRAFVDPKQLYQVVFNLLANAVYAVGERGEIEVRVDAVDASDEDLRGLPEKQSQRYLRIAVSDSGAGMGDGVIEHIFEPFFSTKPSGQGTGLGLSVVHGIVKNHGGTVTVESEPGAGSTFRVYLPDLPVSAAEAKPERQPSAPPAPGVRVMYVDDEEPLVALATRWLGRLGYKVSGFSDSARALQAFRANPQDFDAVISDFAMPGLSGLDLVREILALRPDVIVVMSSGYLKPEDRERARALGALEVVLKPQSMSEFGRILHRVLSERRHAGGAPGASSQ